MITTDMDAEIIEVVSPPAEKGDIYSCTLKVMVKRIHFVGGGHVSNQHQHVANDPQYAASAVPSVCAKEECMNNVITSYSIHYTKLYELVLSSDTPSAHSPMLSRVRRFILLIYLSILVRSYSGPS